MLLSFVCQCRKYSVERFTQAHNLPYYVKETFSRDYDGSLRYVESQVLEQHIYALRDKCFKERTQSKWPFSVVCVAYVHVYFALDKFFYCVY